MAEEVNSIDVTSAAVTATVIDGSWERSSRSQMSHRRYPSDMSDIDFPKLDLLYGPHLKFLHEVGKYDQ